MNPPKSQSIASTPIAMRDFKTVLGVALAILFAVGQPSTSAQTASARPISATTATFRQLLEDSWNHTMEQSPTWASQLGDRRFNHRWEDVSLENFRREEAYLRQLVAKITAINREELAGQDRLNYLLFRYETELALEELSMRTFLIPITQREGIQTVDDLSDSLRFESTRDFEDWLARLKALPAYVDQTIELLRTGIRERRLQPKITMQRLPAQLAKQITEKPAQSPFFKPFTRFPSSIPTRDQDRLSQEALEVISKSVIPAYQRLKSMFESEYLPACFDQVGAWQQPDGDKLYAFLARKFTTTRLTPKQIHEVGRNEVQRIGQQMDTIIAQVGFQGSRQEFFKHLRTDPKFYCKSSQELLMQYRATAKEVDPALLKVFKTIPRAPYGVDPIPDAIAPDTTAAYYRPLAADGSRAGTYFVNLYRPEMRPTYEMMALTLHESVPGHHFQFAVAMEQGDLPKFRRYGGERSYTAYIEGWALYAESLGDEMGLYRDPYSKFGQLTYEMWRAVRLVVDTGIHSLKWDRQRAIDYFLSNAAKSELDVVNEVDRYISWPGQALAYKMGELKIQELRKRAAKLMGTRFDLKEFHDLILKCGAVPLEVLERIVEDWIAGSPRP